MEELKAGWRKVKLGDIIDFNPKETLKKNTISKYVEMAQLQCFARNIIGYSFKEYKGGTKFRNGDTLLARITPCLENGKTAFVDILEEDEVGFGSTEYIVLRKKEGYTDENYIFYLAISDLFRQIAIKSMTGTSGRQRVQTEVLKNSEIVIPEVNIQKKIASILSLLDEKIELNRKINQNLEEIAQALFKRWFIDFEFPNKEGKPYKSSGGKMIKSELGEIPEGWETSELGKIVQISSGKRPKIKFEKNNIKESLYPIVGANGIMGYTNDFLIEDNVILIGRVGTIGNIKIYTFKIWPSDNTLIITSSYLEYMFFILKLFDFTQINRGSTQPLITQTDIKNLKIVVSKKYLAKFCNIISNNFKLIEQNQKETEKLIELRDYLLPKLMNGEIDVSNLKIFEILNSDKFN